MATLNKTQTDFNMLSKSSVFADLNNAKKRLKIINHVGVLSTSRKDLQSVTRMLHQISSQDMFHVVLISPCSRHELDESFSKACPRLILVAENGFFVKMPKQVASQAEWEDVIPLEDISWHEAVIGIMQSYQEKTDGSQVIERDQTITFNYKETDEEFGNWQAKELQTYLQHMFGQLQIIDIVQGQRCIYVHPKDLKRVSHLSEL